MMAETKIAIQEGIHLTDGARGQGIAFNKRTGESFPLNADDYYLVKTIADRNLIEKSEILSHIQREPRELDESLLELLNKGIIVYREDYSNTAKITANEGLLARLTITKAGRYKYKLGNIENFKGLSLFIRNEAWRKIGPRIFPIMVAIGLLEIYGFYFSGVRPLGKIIVNEVFYSPSIYEAFGVFVLSNLMTVIYTIAVGRGKSYGSSVLYLNLLAGFHPVFETEENKSFSKGLRCTRTEYLYYIASPTIMRFYIMMLGILFIHLAYPFGDSLERSFLSIVLTTINISVMALIWQAIPSPGTLSVRVLELFKIIPQKYLGISVRRCWSALKGRSLGKSQAQTKQMVGSIIFLMITLSLILFKICFLGLWVLPHISVGVPQVLGQWTSQLVTAVLGILAMKYMIYSFNPVKKEGRKQNIQQKKYTESGSDPEINQRFSATTLLVFNKFRTRKLAILICIVLLFPFDATVSGSARVQENLSLDIKSSEPESAVINKVLISGPSANVIRKGTPIIELASEGLDLALNKSKEAVKSLESEKAILEVDLKAVSKGGSQYESSKNKTADVIITDAYVRSLKKQVVSLSRQRELLKRQVSKYKRLSVIGAMSELQYEEKLIAYEETDIKYNKATGDLESAIASASKAKNDERIEQNLKLQEDKLSAKEELRKVIASITKEKASLDDLNKRKEALIIKVPFDCVISSDTSLLSKKAISYGNQIISIKSIPTERVIVSVPEYDRNEIKVGDSVEVRLYSRVITRKGGNLLGRVESLSPVSSTEYDQEKLEIAVSVTEKLKDSMIGATGVGKIRVGYTCILLNVLKPIIRFAEVDVWQYLP